MDYYIGSIEEQTLANSFFRKVLFTGEHEQLVVMCLAPGEEIGSEMHPHTDQFFRIEEGEAMFILDGERRSVGSGGAVIVPAGKQHNVRNPSKTTLLKLYTVYAPPNHPDGTVHKTKAEGISSSPMH